MNYNNHNLQEVDRFLQWRHNLCYCLGTRKAAQMNLIDALSSNREAKSVVQLSLNPLFPRKYHSIYRAIKSFVKPIKEVKEAQEQDDKDQDTDELLKIIAETIPSDIKQGNKPINIGHSYSWLC